MEGDLKSANNMRKQKYDYKIADFCSCDGISDDNKALMFGLSNPVKQGGVNMIMLDGRTTVSKLKREIVQKVVRKVRERCKGH